MNFKCIVLWAVLLSCLSCNKKEVQETQFDFLFQNTWVHVVEDISEFEVFKNKQSHVFQPTWFRFEFTLKKGGTCDYLVLAPNDAHYFTTGKWRFIQQDLNLQILDLQGNIIHNFRIEDLDSETLIALRLK